MDIRGLLLPSAMLLWSAAAPPTQPAAPQSKPSPAPAKPAAPAKPRATPAPPPAIEGLVRGPDKKPIEKALVVAVAESQQRFSRWLGGAERPLSARTGPDGRFRLTLRSAQPQTIRVEASGLAAFSRKDVSPGASLTIDLTRGGTIEGVVRDGETGQPVAQARVAARASNAIALPDDPDAGRVVASSDAQGRFKLEGLAAGLHTVSARSRLAGYASRSNVRIGARVELLVFPAATVSGTVTGTNGQPVAHAVVSAAGRPFGRNGTSETSDELGRYELNGLDAGLYDVIARAPGLAPGVAPEVVLDRRSDAHVDLVLRPGARVVGRLVNASERPVAGRVSVGELDGRPTPPLLADPLRTEAPDDGRFAIADVPVGEHALGVNAPGLGAQRVDFAVRGGDRQVDLGDVRLEVGIAIRGRVRSKQGTAIGDATIRGFAMRRGSTFAEGRTEADGSFVLAGLEQVLYNLSIEAPGFGTTDTRAEPGGEPLDLVLEPAGSITGQVVDERGRPLDSFRVGARSGEGPGMRRMPRSEEFTSEDGRFTLDGLGAGTYVVNATAPERAPGNVPGVAVTPGSTVDVGTIKLGAGGVVRGTVADSGGGPVAGARIVVAGQGRDWMSTDATPDSTSDAAGAFEVKGVAPGMVQVTASHPNFAPPEAVRAEIDPTKAPPEVRIVMTQGGRIEGSVRRRDGGPISSAMVSVNIGGMTMGFRGNDARISTGADGRFVVENVRPGRGQLTVMSPGGGGMFQGILRRDVEIREGETASVDIVLREILVSGRVTRAGAPAPGLRVEAMGQRQFMMSGGGPLSGAPPAASSGPQRMVGNTREDGGYEMIVDEPGPLRFNVSSTDGRLRLPTRTAEIPDADAFTLDLTFAGVPVSGIVIDKATEAPLGYANVFARSKAKEGPPGGGGVSGPDGRFQLEVEPGDYLVNASMRDSDYGDANQEVSVGEAGVADVRLALPKGLGVVGKVTDMAGRGVSSIEVTALPTDERPGGWGWSQSLADGSFKLTGLNQGSYTLTAESGTGTFAIRPGVVAGTKDVGLVLQPGGRIALTVVDATGQPVAGAWANVVEVNGLKVGSIGHSMRVTDDQGASELLAPPGSLSIGVSKDKMRGSATVSLAAGETVSLTVRLGPAGAGANR